MSQDTVFWFFSLAESAVIALLLFRRVWRAFPVFFLYSVWTLLSNAGIYVIIRSVGMSSSTYAIAYLAEIVVDSAIQFCVLLELGWSVLRPLRPAPPRTALIPVALLIVVLGAIIWPFAAFPGVSSLSHQGIMVRHIQQTFSILRVLVLLALAGFSQSLALGWRNRELQIATGLGLTSLVSLAVTMLHAYPSMQGQYFHLSELVVASYLCSLVYWIVSFSQKEQERREFSPQVENVLLAVAGAARTTRMALEDAHSGKNRPR